MECEREAVVPIVWATFSAAELSNAGSGRKRGPTLLETHNENSAPTITVTRRIESLDKIDWGINLMRFYQNELIGLKWFRLSGSALI